MALNPHEIEERVKQEFFHLDCIYFNTAYFGPSPYLAKQKVSRSLQKELDPSFYQYQTWIGVPDRLRLEISNLLNCSPENITHSTSTGDVINIVANGYPFKKDDVVCSINRDYPSNVLPWMRAAETRGINFKLLDLKDQVVPTPEWLEEHLPKNTKVFDVSYVTFDTGKKVDILSIGKYLKDRGVFFIVDATQALGGMPITEEELKHIDVLACSSYKWLLGPYGHAFGYFSDNALELIQHTSGNWLNSPRSKVVYSLLDYTTDTLEGARKFDRGQAPNMLTMSCLEAGLEFLNEIGLENIAKHNLQIRDYFLNNYPKSKYELITPTSNMGNIVCIKAKEIDPIRLERELKFRNIDVSVREGNIRLSFHIFNNNEQVDKLIEALDI